MRAPVTLSSTFSLDDIGRYVCNTLDEATASQDPSIHQDARPFEDRRHSACARPRPGDAGVREELAAAIKDSESFYFKKRLP